MIEKMSRKLEPLVTAGCKGSYFRSLKFLIVIVFERKRGVNDFVSWPF